MNNLFLLLFCISFLCIPIFIIWAIINLFRRKPAKKRFASAGISVLALIISTVGFGFTMDDVSPAESVNMVSESPDVIKESPTLQPTIVPTATPTIRPTATPAPTKAPTAKPTASPTLQPTATTYSYSHTNATAYGAPCITHRSTKFTYRDTTAYRNATSKFIN